MAGGGDNQQHMTITNAQGQQITIIPTQSLQQIRPANANIIQMPNMSAVQAFPVQNIPGLGNVQVSLLIRSDHVLYVKSFRKSELDELLVHLKVKPHANH